MAADELGHAVRADIVADGLGFPGKRYRERQPT
jgi:hypothetical protein